MQMKHVVVGAEYSDGCVPPTRMKVLETSVRRYSDGPKDSIRVEVLSIGDREYAGVERVVQARVLAKLWAEQVKENEEAQRREELAQRLQQLAGGETFLRISHPLAASAEEFPIRASLTVAALEQLVRLAEAGAASVGKSVSSSSALEQLTS